MNQALGLLLLVAGLLLAVLEHAGATAIPVSFAVLIGGMGLVSLTLGVVAEAAGREQRRVTTDDDQQRLTAVHRASRAEAVTSTDVHGTYPSAAA